MTLATSCSKQNQFELSGQNLKGKKKIKAHALEQKKKKAMRIFFSSFDVVQRKLFDSSLSVPSRALKAFFKLQFAILQCTRNEKQLTWPHDLVGERPGSVRRRRRAHQVFFVCWSCRWCCRHRRRRRRCCRQRRTSSSIVLPMTDGLALCYGLRYREEQTARLGSSPSLGIRRGRGGEEVRKKGNKKKKEHQKKNRGARTSK